MTGKLIMALREWLTEPVAMAHSTPDRKPGQTASGYSFGLFHGYTIGHKVDYYWIVQKMSNDTN